MAFLFPWSNLHDVNLDWIIDQLKNCVEAVKKIPTRTSQLINDSGYITQAVAAPVQSVNGQVGDVLLDIPDRTSQLINDSGYITQAQAAPVQSVNGQTGSVVLDAADVGALPDSYTPPVTSVNGNTGAVVLDAADVGALPDSYTPPVTSVNGSTGAVVLSIPAASTSNPLMDGTVSIGTSADYAKADHRHPKDTSKANLASPTFTGTPKAPTAASGNNSTQIATTAFVHNEINNAELITATFSDVSTSVTVAQQYVAKNNQVYSLRVSFHVTAAIANNTILFNVNIPQPFVGGAYWIRSASNGTFAGVNLQAKSSSDHSLCVKSAGNIPVGDWYGLAVTYIGDPAAM